MTNSNMQKAIPLYLATVLILSFFSCSSGSKQTSVHNKNELNFQIPKLAQQEIASDDSGESEEYSLYDGIRSDGPVIPGIFQSAVPQGMAYYAEADLMFLSNYMFDGRPSCITTVNMANKLLQKTLWLQNPDGTAHMGHVGGLAVSKKYLWIASGKGVYNIPLENIISASDNSNITMLSFFNTEAKGSFASFTDNVLWVGEFTSKDGSYSVPKSHYFKSNKNNTNHAWMAGYKLDSESDLINDANKIDGIYYPNFILSIPDEVQGAAFINGKIILSRSYGRKNNSRLAIYTDIRQKFSDTEYIAKDNRSIPVWVLEKQNLELEITAPPMTEGLTNYKGSLAALFESGSDKYRTTAKNPQDRIGILNINL